MTRPLIAFLYNQRTRYPSPDDPASQLESDFDDPATIEGLTGTLERLGCDVLPIEADEQAYPALLAARGKITLALNYSIGRHGLARYAQLPAMLEMLRIPYTGSDPLVQALIQDKARMQAVLAAHGVKVPVTQVFREPDAALEPSLAYPLLVKPATQGSSAGITHKSVVKTDGELRAELQKTLATFGAPALVQTFLTGREFSVPLLGALPRVLPPIEPDFSLLPPGYPPLDSLEVKWIFEEETSAHHLRCPAPVDAALAADIERLSLRTWHALGLRDWCRIDMRADAAGVLHVLDVNSPPGLLPPSVSTTSYFPLSARAAGIEFDELVAEVLRTAAVRTGVALGL